MNNKIIFKKILQDLPTQLDKDALYFLKSGDGFDVYATSSDAATAYKMNMPKQFTSTDGSVSFISTSGQIDFSALNTKRAGALVSTVRNETNEILPKGTIVYISGAASNKALVSKASAANESTSSKTFAVLLENIAINSNGLCVNRGTIDNIDTSALTEGAALWLSSTNLGQWTTTKPQAPNHLVFIGIVTRVHQTQGAIDVSIQNGFELDELHNVKINNPTHGDQLVYDASIGCWINMKPIFMISFMDDSATDLHYRGGYVGSTWQVMKTVTATGTQTIANMVNNSTVAALDQAWLNRDTLSYS